MYENDFCSILISIYLHTHPEPVVILWMSHFHQRFVASVVPWRHNIAPRRRNRPTELSQLAAPPLLSMGDPWWSQISQIPEAICKAKIGQVALEHQDITHKNVLVDHGG
jgi:hypothetical protein